MTAIRLANRGLPQATPKHDKRLGGGNSCAEILLLRVPGGHWLHSGLGAGRNRHMGVILIPGTKAPAILSSS